MKVNKGKENKVSFKVFQYDYIKFTMLLKLGGIYVFNSTLFIMPLTEQFLIL